MDNRVDSIVKAYRKNLENLGILAEKIILFGSYATGNNQENSDLDLLVVSRDFTGMDLWERLRLLGFARLGFNRPMEIMGITVEEFSMQGKGSFIGDEVKEKGIEII